jgi:hypothetical protein
MLDINIAEEGPIETSEQVAREKIIDPYSDPFPFWHYTNAEKLMDVLREGIMAESFSKRIGKKNFRRGFSSSWNDTHVSITNAEGFGYPFIEAGVFIKPLGEVKKADKSLRRPGDELDPEAHEHLSKRRIAPREFTGVYLGDRFPQGMSKYKLFNSIIDYFSTNPDRSLPIYDYRGLIWPTKMTKEQLRGSV